MKRKTINKLPVTGPMLVAVLFLSSCLFPAMWNKPGYGIDTNVPQIPKASIVSIQNILKTEAFELINEQHYYVRDEFVYKKDMPTVAKKVDHPYIFLTLSYDKIKGQIPEHVTSLGVGMGNEWNGQESQLKQEMDRTADILIAEIKKLVEQKNIAVERTTISPPF